MKEDILHRQDTSPPTIPRVRLLPITGLSGAGRTRSLKALEDLGFEVIDNLPLSLIGSLLFPLIQPGEGDHAITIAVDFRKKNFNTEAFDQATAPLADRDDIEMTTVFLDCDNEVLARRFTETRRCHPLGVDRPVMDGIVREWHLLAPFKKRADLVIDTTNLTAGELRALIDGHFRRADTLGLTVTVISFSYRLGLPREADLVFDVRFLANPRCVDGLRPLTGNDPAVGAYVVADPECEPFLESFDQILQTLIPLYVKEGNAI